MATVHYCQLWSIQAKNTIEHSSDTTAACPICLVQIYRHRVTHCSVAGPDLTMQLELALNFTVRDCRCAPPCLRCTFFRFNNPILWRPLFSISCSPALRGGSPGAEPVLGSCTSLDGLFFSTLSQTSEFHLFPPQLGCVPARTRHIFSFCAFAGGCVGYLHILTVVTRAAKRLACR